MKAGPSIKRRDNELPGRADQTNEIEQGKRRKGEKSITNKNHAGAPRRKKKKGNQKKARVKRRGERERE